MLKIAVKAHKEPSKTFQALVVGFAIGVFTSLTIALWQDVTILCRVSLLAVLALSLYYSCKLAKYKDNYANDGNDRASDNAR